MIEALPYRWLLVVFFILSLVVLSVTPAQYQAGDSVFKWLVVATPTPLQKFLHIALYALLSFLLVWAMEPMQQGLTGLLIALTIAIAIGALLEWAQTAIPSRFGTLLDVLLDGAGALIGIVAAFLFL